MFTLPSSVLEAASAATSPHGSSTNYKAAVDKFIQNGGDAVGGHKAKTPGDSSLTDAVSDLHMDDRPSFLPPADQTQALERLFASVKTLTAKEDLLQTLR